MKAEYLCPECGSPLRSQLKSCACGWQPAIKKSSTTGNGASGIVNCSYVVNGERCQRPGTISPSVLGQGAWYCGEHIWQANSSSARVLPAHDAAQPIANVLTGSTWAKRIAGMAPRRYAKGEKP